MRYFIYCFFYILNNVKSKFYHSMNKINKYKHIENKKLVKLEFMLRQLLVSPCSYSVFIFHVGGKDIVN